MRIFKPKPRRTKQERRAEKRAISKRKAEYAEYLESDYWKQVSAAVKARAGHRCQVCNSPKNLTTHHRTYSNKGKEMEHLDDLTCLCWPCHSLFHERSKLMRADKPKPKVKTPLYLSDHLDQ